MVNPQPPPRVKQLHRCSLGRRGRAALTALVAAGALAMSLGVEAALVSSIDCVETTVTASVVADTWLDENSPSSSKSGDSVLNVDGGSLNVDTQDVSGRARALVRFALADAAPPGCVVGSARLFLFASEETVGARAEAVALASAWSESSVSWSSQPATVGPVTRIWSREGYMQWNVTAQVQAMLDGGENHGFVIRDAAEGTETAAGHGFYGREKGDPATLPKLVVHFAAPDSGEPPGPPAPPTSKSVTCGEVLLQSTLVTNDLSGCLGDGLVIGASRIIVDLGGHSIDGTGLGAGIANEGHTEVTVRNGTLQEFDYGLKLAPETTHNVVESLTLRQNQVAAVELFDVVATAVRGNILDGNGGGIMLVSGTRDSVVANNAVTANGGAGVLVQDATGNRIEGNSIAGGGDLGIGLERANGNVLIGNTSSDNSDGGIELRFRSHDNRLENNTVTGSGDHGILVSESDRNQLIDNVAHDMSDSGITLDAANDGVVRGNDVRFNTGGLQLDGSSRNVLATNDASETSGIGIELGGGSLGNVLEGNIADANAAHGIYVSDEATDPKGALIAGLGNLVIANSTIGNRADGIVIAKGGHTVAGNVTRNNSSWGILAAPGTIDGSGNVGTGNGKEEQCSGVVCRPEWLPPETQITGAPAAFTSSRPAQIVFTGSDDTSPASSLAFACSLDGGAFVTCASPRLYSALAEGPHTFAVRGTDAAGNTDATPATHSWTVDSVPPQTAIVEAPPERTRDTSARFRFAGADNADPAPTFECRLDAAPTWSPCASPTDVIGLAEGARTFEVRAVDGAGNVDPSPAARLWAIDTTPPEIRIDSAPKLTTNLTTATFELSTEPEAMLACSLDGAAFTPCGPAITYSGLADGVHAFAAQATDAVGNVDGSAAVHTWTVDTREPETTIASGPLGPTQSTVARFEFSADEPGAAFECALDESGFEPCTAGKEYATLAEGTHSFRVRAVDEVGNVDATPAGWTWRVDTLPPETTIDAGPAGLGRSPSATFRFSADEEATFACSLDGAPFAACSPPLELHDLADGSHTLLVRATDLAGNTDGSPASRAWQVDTIPPETVLHAGPELTRDPTPTFAFSSEDGAGFECRVDDALFAACASPFTSVALADGAHVFEVRATDAAGNADASPAGRSFTVDTVAPETAVDAGPAGPTSDPTPTFAFSSEPGASFECRVGDGTFAVCESPFTVAALADGAHRFEVQATDAAGNTDPSSASRSFTVDTVAPDATIDAGPAGPTNDATPTFAFSSEPGASLTCRVDGGAFGACISPFTPSALADGPHTFEVRATDAAGNSSLVSRAFTVDTVAPAVAIDSGPSGVTSDATPSFAFSSELGASLACRVDGGSFAACVSAFTTASLADGGHVFEVRATDAAGNGSEASSAFTVDTVAPAVAIDSGPSGATDDATPTFAFSSEPDAELACRVDGAVFAACESPFTTVTLADGAHTFEVRATDAAGNSSVASRAFAVDTAVPQTIVDSAPPETTQSTSATFAFSSSEAGSTFECALDGAAFAACTSPREYTGLAVGPHEFRVLTIDAAGNRDPSPATRAWTIQSASDVTPPETTIGDRPPATTQGTSATFTFSSSEAGSTFECALDGAAFAACTSPRGYTGLAVGPHEFRVRAIDPAGNLDGTPATHNWTIQAPPDTTAPETSIAGQPPSPSNSTSATFTFGGTDNETPQSLLVFQCRVDSQSESAFVSCSSPRVVSALSQGSHTFQVRAIDLAGNRDLTPAAFAWTVDTSAPDTTIGSGPPSSTTSASASFSFTASQSGSTFQCSLDGAAFEACTSPRSYSGLAAGSHQFRVRAIDAAGNVDASPAARSWTIQAPPDTTAPDTTITSAPPSSTTSTSASFGFSSSESGSTFQCSLDGVTFATCTSPRSYSGLAVGSHQFRVRAIDATGNVDGSPAAHSWTIQAAPDTTPPDTTIIAAPSSSTTSTSASFSFSSSEPGSIFECSLDGSAFAACSSPRAYTGLGLDAHQFQVRAIDAAGNVDSSPATHSWTIQASSGCTGSTVAAAAAADSWLLQSSATSNYGNDSVVKVDSKAGASARALFRFALPALPPGCTVVDARLRLYASSFKSGRMLHALRVGAGWMENGVTWTNQPAATGPAAVASSVSGYVEWTVGSQVQAMYDGSNHGFLVRDASEGDSGVEQNFHSREKGSDNPPRLVVTFG